MKENILELKNVDFSYGKKSPNADKALGLFLFNQVNQYFGNKKASLKSGCNTLFLLTVHSLANTLVSL